MSYKSPYEREEPNENLTPEERGQVPTESPLGGVPIPPSSDYMQEPTMGIYGITPAPPDDIEPDDAPPREGDPDS